MTADDLERRAIIAAHDAECLCDGADHYDYGSYRGLTEAEHDIVEAWRADRERVRALHAPTGTHLVAEIDGFGGEQREIEPDSFEEITSREVVCMACNGYPAAPCPTIHALDAMEATP